MLGPPGYEREINKRKLDVVLNIFFYFIVSTSIVVIYICGYMIWFRYDVIVPSFDLFQYANYIALTSNVPSFGIYVSSFIFLFVPYMFVVVMAVMDLIMLLTHDSTTELLDFLKVRERGNLISLPSEIVITSVMIFVVVCVFVEVI
jgi:hypothetical protein